VRWHCASACVASLSPVLCLETWQLRNQQWSGETQSRYRVRRPAWLMHTQHGVRTGASDKERQGAYNECRSHDTRTSVQSLGRRDGSHAASIPANHPHKKVRRRPRRTQDKKGRRTFNTVFTSSTRRKEPTASGNSLCRWCHME